MKKNVWLLRPLPHFGDHLQKFLEKNIIAVGYPVGENFTGYDTNQIRKALQKKDWSEGIGNVNILVNDMTIGDLVVVPASNKKDIYFGEITSDYKYEFDLDKDIKGTSGYPHQRNVKWFFDKKPYLRNDLPEALKGSLRYPGAVADLTKHYEIVEQILHGDKVHETDLEKKAWLVVEELLESTDDMIRLKAAEIILAR